MAYNIRVNSLLKGFNISLEDFRFFMSNDEINTTSKVRVVTNGERTYNPKLMTTTELVELRESLLRDIEEKEISKLHKQLDEAKDEDEVKEVVDNHTFYRGDNVGRTVPKAKDVQGTREKTSLKEGFEGATRFQKLANIKG